MSIRTSTAEETGEHSIAGILKDIGSSLQQIVRLEINLAKIEVSEAARRARGSSIVLAGGALLAVFALGFVLLAIMFALEFVVAAWLAALIVGVVLLIGGSIGLAAGVRGLKAIRPPVATMQTVSEDVKWIKEQPKS